MADWREVCTIPTQSWRCGYCDRDISSDRGWYAVDGFGHARAYVAICPRCTIPSVISEEGHAVPAARYGDAVDYLPSDLESLHTEARNAVGNRAPNSAALACRKLLMHVAVEKGAPAGQSFLSYVEYLAANGYVPPDAREWIDEIREHGNDANHEIDLMSQEEAEDMVDFTTMLLRVVFEYPERGRRTRAARQERRP